MRVAIVDPYYPAFLDRHYAEDPELADAPYAEQRDSLMASSFGTFDAYSRHLRPLGHEAVELVPNCVPLQLRWAEENGTGRALRTVGRVLPGRAAAVARQPLLRRIVRAQIAAFDPEVVYLQSLDYLSPDELRELRDEGRFVVGQIASPAPSDAHLRSYDLIVSSFPHFVARFREMGVDSEYLPLAFDPAVLERLAAAGVPVDAPSGRPHAVAFVGGVDPRVHAEGTALLERLAGEVDISVWGYGADRLDSSSPLRARHRGEAWGLDMFSVFARSRIVVNRHIDVADGYANNMRLYEATGVGAVLLTDAKRNLGDLFDVGREVVAYEDLDDLVARLAALTADDEECDRIGAAGQARTLREHGYDTRMRQLSGILEERLARYAARSK